MSIVAPRFNDYYCCMKLFNFATLRVLIQNVVFKFHQRTKKGIFGLNFKIFPFCVKLCILKKSGSSFDIRPLLLQQQALKYA